MTQAMEVKLGGWFYRLLVYGMIALFAGIIFYVVLSSHHRKSGKTGQDAARMQMIRVETDRAVGGGRIPAREAEPGRQ